MESPRSGENGGEMKESTFTRAVARCVTAWEKRGRLERDPSRDDQELLGAERDESDAFGELWRVLVKMIQKRWLRPGNQSLAEDFTQEAITTFKQALERQVPDHPPSYLATTAENKVKQVKAGERITTVLADGRLVSRVEAAGEKTKPRRSKSQGKDEPAGLFESR